MSWITARRRHPAAGYVIVAFVLVLIGVGYAVVTSGRRRPRTSRRANSAQIAQGRSLFLANCSTCHGLYAAGQPGRRPA